jgi:serine/threonine protein kinase
MALERIGPYRIIRLLGKGGMGAVYEGLHEAIERRVAIKVLHAELGRRSDIATRFINEARAVNRIDHPGLVQVSDYGQLPDGMAYIVMEYLKGETLGQRLKRVAARLPAMDVIRLGRQLCTALAAAHEKEIVHRDLKPDNIMIIPNPDVPGGEQIKILDFGIAKLTEAETGTSEAHTRADALLGTPRYMSPEQCRGGASLDAKSDVYSLGVRADRRKTRRPSERGAPRRTERHRRQRPPGGERGGRMRHSAQYGVPSLCANVTLSSALLRQARSTSGYSAASLGSRLLISR